MAASPAVSTREEKKGERERERWLRAVLFRAETRVNFIFVIFL
jgi:hypothetical protein